jgi:flagellar assembly protein FliH
LSKPNPSSPPSSPPATTQEFRFQQFIERTSQQPSFQFAWPELKGPKGSSRFEQNLGDIEAKVLKQSKEKLLILEKEAYEKGFAQGEKDGLELGQKKNGMIIQQMQNLLAEMERQRNALYRNHVREMIQLILKIAQKVIHRETLSQEGILVQNLEQAIQQAVDRKKIFVHINPADTQCLQGHPELEAFFREEDRGLKMMEDPSIQRGGCLLQTSFGDIDATIENQIDQIASRIWQIFEESSLPIDSTP